MTGVPASGKSTLARRLASDLGWSHLDIADMPGHLVEPSVAWRSLAAAIGQSSGAVVETAGTSPYEQGFWKHLTITTIRVTVARDVQAQRLGIRPQTRSEDDYVERMLAIPEPARGEYEWLGTEPIPGAAYDELLACVRPVERQLMVVVG